MIQRTVPIEIINKYRLIYGLGYTLDNRFLSNYNLVGGLYSVRDTLGSTKPIVVDAYKGKVMNVTKETGALILHYIRSYGSDISPIEIDSNNSSINYMVSPDIDAHYFQIFTLNSYAIDKGFMYRPEAKETHQFIDGKYFRQASTCTSIALVIKNKSNDITENLLTAIQQSKILNYTDDEPMSVRLYSIATENICANKKGFMYTLREVVKASDCSAGILQDIKTAEIYIIGTLGLSKLATVSYPEGSAEFINNSEVNVNARHTLTITLPDDAKTELHCHSYPLAIFM